MTKSARQSRHALPFATSKEAHLILSQETLNSLPKQILRLPWQSMPNRGHHFMASVRKKRNHLTSQVCELLIELPREPHHRASDLSQTFSQIGLLAE